MPRAILFSELCYRLPHVAKLLNTTRSHALYLIQLEKNVHQWRLQEVKENKVRYMLLYCNPVTDVGRGPVFPHPPPRSP